VIAVFALVYTGMVFGRLPGLVIDRTGIALLGAVILIAGGRSTPEQAWEAIDVPTVALLFGLMVVSAQLRLGGFYAEATRRLARADVTPPALLAAVIGVAAALSAVVANDIVCFAMAPPLAVGCLRRGLRPEPFLLALACSANVGSAATIIGNPQNMLIGQRLGLGFAAYLLDGLPPALLGCGAVWAIVVRLQGGRWLCEPRDLDEAAPPFDRWQSGKGAVVALSLVAAFLVLPVPRDTLALIAAGLLLLSRRMHSRPMLGLVDWHLLVLFCGLFVVQHALEGSGAVARFLDTAADAGVDLTRSAWLFGVTAVLSNLVSNVPAVMLLLPAATRPQAGAVLALSSTFAGNLLLVGSIANLIVVERASQLGIRIGWRDHARVGVPVTLATLAIAALWLALRAAMTAAPLP